MTPKYSDRSPAPERATWLRLTVILLAIFVVVEGDRFFYAADYMTWRYDWTTFIKCVGDFYCPHQSLFPLAYLANSAVSSNENLSYSITILELINFLFLLLPLRFIWILHSRQIAITLCSIYLAAVFFSPLPAFYLLSGALEVQSGVLVGIFLGCLFLWLDGRDNQDRTALKAAGISAALMLFYKDTIILQVFISVIVALMFWVLTNSDHLTFLRRLFRISCYIVPIVVFCSIIILVFNYLRYQTFIPAGYLRYAAATSPPLSVTSRFFLWSVISPNGGLLAFWLLPYAVLAGSFYFYGLKPVRAALWATCSLVSISLVAFAFWWAPFGWDSWGNRLIVPAALSGIVSMTISARPTDHPVGNRPWPILILLSPMVLYSAYYWSVPLISSKAAVFAASLHTGPQCERMYRMISEESAARGVAIWRDDRYYQCAWERFRHIPVPLWR